MHQLILLAGFAGAWLLVVGPLQQAVIELSEEGLEREHIHDAMLSVTAPTPVSPWWWLLPPVRLYLGSRVREQWHGNLRDQLPVGDYEALTSYMSKAYAWLLVGTGGFLIAAKETYELVEGLDWPIWIFWPALVALLFLSVAAAAVQSARLSREAATRAAVRDT